MENVELRIENYWNKMLRILIGLAATGRCFNRFYASKRVLSFSILHSPFKLPLALSFYLTSNFVHNPGTRIATVRVLFI
ncbi:hypothetical protein [Eubacterium callanderi]|uniref:hypothetical protein n=1 Tax=Eubacterium callanderi TaxID=53442 RepID=UPI0022DF3078|nr:hypothetical protein [Eubacterium callanderi]